MLELKYLSPWLTGINSSLVTFIGNAISVTLIAWPMMPIAIQYLSWWLFPTHQNLSKKQVTILGTGILLLLYLIEILIFWNFLT